MYIYNIIIYITNLNFHDMTVISLRSANNSSCPSDNKGGPYINIRGGLICISKKVGSGVCSKLELDKIIVPATHF